MSFRGSLEPPGRIELPSRPYQGRVLPLNYGDKLRRGNPILARLRTPARGGPLEPSVGVEPTSAEYETAILPLNYDDMKKPPVEDRTPTGGFAIRRQHQLSGGWRRPEVSNPTPLGADRLAAGAGSQSQISRLAAGGGVEPLPCFRPHRFRAGPRTNSGLTRQVLAAGVGFEPTRLSPTYLSSKQAL